MNELQASAALLPDLIDSDDGYRTTLRNVCFGLNINAADRPRRLYVIYRTAGIIKLSKSRMTTCVEHVARMGELRRGYILHFWSKNRPLGRPKCT